ncbi:MAG: hypothetical protein R3D00_00895 [Bacteroidia bacterium]
MEDLLNIRFQIPSVIHVSEKICSGNLVLESEAGCTITAIEISFEESKLIAPKDSEAEIIVSVLGKYDYKSELVLLPGSLHILEFDFPFSRQVRRHQLQFPLWGKFGQQLKRIYNAVDLENSEFVLKAEVYTKEEKSPVTLTAHVRVSAR